MTFDEALKVKNSLPKTIREQDLTYNPIIVPETEIYFSEYKKACRFYIINDNLSKSYSKDNKFKVVWICFNRSINMLYYFDLK